MSVWLAVAFVVIGAAILAALAYWLVVLSEGVYIGPRFVVWLYDLYATRYDRIKDWDPADEIFYLADPFVAEIGAHRRPPLILDVAAGTGRLLRSVEAAGLLPDARWVLVDASRRMLEQAGKHIHCRDRVHFVHRAACPLPFPDDTFDAVACLEAIEFMPDPDAALAELVRVLRPGGYLLMTNRIGSGVRWLPGRTWSQDEVYRRYKALGVHHVSIRTFLVDYEWVSGVKAGALGSGGHAADPALISLLEELADFG